MDTEVWPIEDENGVTVCWARTPADAHRIAWLMGMYEQYGALESRQHERRMKDLAMVRRYAVALPVVTVLVLVVPLFLPGEVNNVPVSEIVARAFMLGSCVMALHTVSRVNTAMRSRFDYIRRKTQ